VITARGSDVTLIPEHALARRWIRWAAKRSVALVAVSEALAARMGEIGLDRAKISVLRNGVDLDRFRPLDRDESRRSVGMHGPLLLSVGSLVELKGHHLVIEALADLPDWNLLIAGDGPLRSALEERARTCGCADRVRFAGPVRHEELVRYYNAADAVVLASSREGMANVVLEAAACGTPVVATRVGGNAEVIEEPAMGRLLSDRSAAAIVAAVRDLQSQPAHRAQIRDRAERLSWGPTIAGLVSLFERVRRPGPI
jgi:glycosyltransferase involved in cell wall biosynthesis